MKAQDRALPHAEYAYRYPSCCPRGAKGGATADIFFNPFMCAVNLFFSLSLFAAATSLAHRAVQGPFTSSTKKLVLVPSTRFRAISRQPRDETETDKTKTFLTEAKERKRGKRRLGSASFWWVVAVEVVVVVELRDEPRLALATKGGSRAPVLSTPTKTRGTHIIHYRTRPEAGLRASRDENGYLLYTRGKMTRDAIRSCYLIYTMLLLR